MGTRGAVQRKSVPVSSELLNQLRSQPDEFGLGQVASEAARLQALLEMGAAAARERVEAEEMEAAFRDWALDEERHVAVHGMAEHILREGGLLDQALGRAETSRSE